MLQSPDSPGLISPAERIVVKQGECCIKFSPRTWEQLYRKGDFFQLCENFIAAGRKLGDITIYDFNDELQCAFDNFAATFLYLFTRPDFTIPETLVQPLFLSHPAITNIVALSVYQNTDIWISFLNNGPKGPILKKMFLYNANNQVRLDIKEFFDASPRIASIWWSQYWSTALNSSPVAYKNARAHLEKFDDRFCVNYACFGGFFECSYLDSVKELEYKKKMNSLVSKTFSSIKFTSISNPKSIAIVSGLWRRGHSVHRCLKDFIASLYPDYTLTLISLGEPSPDEDTSLFHKVIHTYADGGVLRVGEFCNNDFAAAFYPDIGMMDDGIILSNLRIAPVQICGYGHPVSNYGSQIDYFIGGSSVEDISIAPQQYSERLVLLPGLGALGQMREPPPQEQQPQNPDICVINCSWSSQKINYPLLSILEVIKRRCTKPLLFRFFPQVSAGQNNALSYQFSRNLTTVLGKENCQIINNLKYRDYIWMMANGTFSLDSYPFCGFNTVYDCLCVKKPIVTWKGDRACNRLASALLETLGLNELVATNRTEYIEKTLQLIQDSSYRNTLEKKIGNIDLSARLAGSQDPAFFRKAIDYLIANHPILSQQNSREPILIMRRM